MSCAAAQTGSAQRSMVANSRSMCCTAVSVTMRWSTVPPFPRRQTPCWLAACRAGTVSVVNTPGNGVADDKAMYAFVHTMITYYLGEESLIGDVGTWVLADPNQYEGVRHRLHELVVKPVDGSGGAGVMIGPDLSRAGDRRHAAEVEAAPHRFIAQEVIRFSSHPTLTTAGLAPRHVDLRVFALAGRDGRGHGARRGLEPGCPRVEGPVGELLTRRRLQGHLVVGALAPSAQQWRPSK